MVGDMSSGSNSEQHLPRSGPTSGDPGWSGTTFAHEAFFFDDDQQVIDRCRPLIEAGLALHQPVLVVVSDPVRVALERGLGPSARSLAMFDRAESWWQGPHATMATYAAVLRRLGLAARPWRLVAEPVWLSTASGRYWSRFEAVANISLSAFPFYSLCLHDLRRLDGQAVHEARRTHPHVVDATDPGVSSSWTSAVDFLRSVEPPPRERPPNARVLHHTSLGTARAQARTACSEARLSLQRCDEVALAIDELASNSRAVAAQVTVADWQHGRQLVLEVTDSGPGFDDPLAGYVAPPQDGVRGRGLWLARGLADELVIRSGRSGTTVQVLVELDTTERRRVPALV
jgi:anti-sigma regulatory factor (Ser/Thr protein kinase)